MRRTAVLALSLLASLVPAATASAQEPGTLELLKDAHLEITGIDDGLQPGWHLGWSVDGAGDVNGDGRGDVIVGAPWANPSGREEAGSAFVVFGRSAKAKVDVNALGSGGFRIDGAQGLDRELLLQSSQAGISVSGLGDVNGDGLDDVGVGGPGTNWASYDGRGPFQPFRGAAFVVFGSASTQTVDLAALGGRGFAIRGPAPNSRVGYGVEGVGDFNGDGRADVGVPGPSGGSSYVVYGKASTDAVDIPDAGAVGMRIDGTSNAVVGAGDVNADGYDDIVVGRGPAKVSSFVVFGRAQAGSVDVAALGAGGFEIAGEVYALGGGGDVNGDGRDDVVLGHESKDLNGRLSGSVWVVFGKGSSAPVALDALGAGGFRIDGRSGDQAGKSTATIDDLNGDGRDDVIVGAPMSTPCGAVYVVLGKTSTIKVNLNQLGAGGFRITGGKTCGRAGFSSGPVDDVTGDGRAEVVIGAPYGTNPSSWVAEAPPLLGTSTTSGPPTSVLQLSGAFFAAGEPISVALDGVAVASTVADAGGNFAKLRVVVPASTLPGNHRFSAVGGRSGRVAVADYLVRTSWTHAGFGAARTSFNPYENILGRSTVAGLAPAWSIALQGPFAGSPIYAAGNVHVASAAGAVSTLDPLTGRLLWTKPTGGAITSGPAAANSNVYVGAGDGKLYAFEKRLGNIRFVKQTGGPITASPVVSAGVLYVHSDDGYVYALDPNNGSEIWKAFLGPASGSPAVASSRLIAVSGSRLVAFSPGNGATLWTREIAGASSLTAPAAASGVVYVGAGGAPSVTAVSATTGAVKWSRAVGSDVTALAVGEGVVYAQGSAALHALNAADGVPRFARDGAAVPGSAFTLANHVLYLPGPRALNAATGATLWSGGSGAASPAVADGLLLAGGTAYKLP